MGRSDNPLLTLGEFAKEVGFSYRQVQRWVRDRAFNGLPCSRRGTHWRIPLREGREWFLRGNDPQETGRGRPRKAR